MMRANLLPRSKGTVAVFGFALAADHVREAVLGAAIVLAVACIGIGIERVRIARLEAVAARSAVDVALRRTERNETRMLALDVARYREFEREAAEARSTGADAALAVARIGNSVPRRVWFDDLDPDARGYAIAGEATSFETLGRAIVALGKALPRAGASLVTIDNRDPGSAAHFSARLDKARGAGGQ